MTKLIERLEDLVHDLDRAQGDERTKAAIRSMASLLVEQMTGMDLSDAPSYRGMKLLPLGQPVFTVDVGNVSCTRHAYLGSNGKFYIEGPRKSLGRVVIDIHPYGVSDTRGWDGITEEHLAELLTTYFI